jgi:hypothetical protein
MKLVQSMSALASLPVLVLTLMSPLAAQSVPPTGTFGFLLTTSFSNPDNQGGAAILGKMNFDGAGRVSGPYTLEFGSGGPGPVQTINGRFSGSYSSNADGSGSVTIHLDNGTTLTLAMVIADAGHGLEFIVTSCSGGIDLAVSVAGGFAMHAKATVPGAAAALNGTYGGQFSFSPQPSRFNTLVSFDGAGNTTMATTFVSVGPSVSTDVYPGAYTVNTNGTGTITLFAVPNQGPQTFSFVITDEGGPGLLLLQTDRLGNGVSFGSARRR